MEIIAKDDLELIAGKVFSFAVPSETFKEMKDYFDCMAEVSRALPYWIIRAQELEERLNDVEGILNKQIKRAEVSEAEVQRYREALEKLARLGNEPHYGNSIGNEIAKEALRKEGER